MGETLPDLVSSEWLADNLAAPDLVILDASRHLPAAGRDPRDEFGAAHIPGARFLDLESLTDTSSPVPAAMPNAAQFAKRLADLGIARDTRVVLYDDSAVKTAARAWFMFKAFGLDAVALLDGGLAKWRSEDRPLEGGDPQFASASAMELPPAEGVATKGALIANLEKQSLQVLDARSADRVFGTGIDPVHGGQNGRIPGSFNLPFGDVFEDDGTFKSPEDLRRAFSQAGVDLEQPVVTTCGSGVTASVLLFAMHLIGKYDTALYDGSWQEWSADPDTPKAQGPE